MNGSSPRRGIAQLVHTVAPLTSIQPQWYGWRAKYSCGLL